MCGDFLLENGIYYKGTIRNFKLFYEETELTPVCSDISYIPSTLIALKTENVMYVYEPKVINVNGKLQLSELAKLELQIPSAYVKLVLGNKAYIIDSNLQITFCVYSNLT